MTITIASGPGGYIHRTMIEILQEVMDRLDEDPEILQDVKKVMFLAHVPSQVPNMHVPVFEAALRKIGGSSKVAAYDSAFALRWSEKEKIGVRIVRIGTSRLDHMGLHHGR